MLSPSSFAPNGREASSAPLGREATSGVQTLVIVGHGMVAYRLCRRLTEDRARSIQIIVIGEEPRLAYDRVNLTQMLRGTACDALVLADRDWYETRGIELISGERVVSGDPDARTIQTDVGRVVAYDQLILATGARPFIPPIPGLEGANVFEYRTAADLDAIRWAASTSRRAIVLGGGVLGLEAARAMTDLGLQTTVVESRDRLMARQLDDPRAAELLLRRVIASGIDVRVGLRTERVERDGHGFRLRFETGAMVEAELIIVATGVRPRDELAGPLRLRRASKGGFDVDAQLQTSQPNVFAIGECASYQGEAPGFVAPGHVMADLLAERLLGQSSRLYEPALPECDLKEAGVEVSRIGEPMDATDYVHANEDTLRVIQIRDGKLVGLTSVGEWDQLSQAREAVRRQQSLSLRSIRRFVTTGELPNGLVLPIADWPAERLVCNCIGISRGQLSAAMTGGACTAERLATATGASTMCGSCEPLLIELCGAKEGIATPSRRRKRVWAFAASLMGLAIVAILAIAPPPGFASSVQQGWHHVDALWRIPWIKQTTGFGLLGLSLLASGIAARKRLRWFQWGDFAWHRAAHTTIAVIALTLLVAHSGLSLGHNLNFGLMTMFLFLCVLGTLTGVVSHLEAGRHRTATLARRFRPVVGQIHLFATWPMAVLLGFHVVSAYYF